MINVEETIISQYGNSATIVQLVRFMNTYIDPRADIDNFYDYVWNVETAQGFGLDIWGRIVDVERQVNIPADTPNPGGKFNQIRYSEQFQNGIWTKVGSTILTDAINSPFVNLTADKIVENSGAASTHRAEQFFLGNKIASNYSVFAKAETRTKFEILAEDGSASGALFDLSNGTKSAPQSPGVANASATATIESIADGWYRCAVSRTPTNQNCYVGFRLSNGTTTNYAGDGTSGLYLFGAQVSYSPIMDYVKTEATPATFTPGVYTMSDEEYRLVILVKALANITNCTARGLNQLLLNILAVRGRAYVLDTGSMTMRLTFEYFLTPFEYVILTTTGIAPRPAGVLANILQVDVPTTFGFAEGVQFQPFDQGVFYVSI